MFPRQLRKRNSCLKNLDVNLDLLDKDDLQTAILWENEDFVMKGCVIGATNLGQAKVGQAYLDQVKLVRDFPRFELNKGLGDTAVLKILKTLHLKPWKH